MFSIFLVLMFLFCRPKSTHSGRKGDVFLSRRMGRNYHGETCFVPDALLTFVYQLGEIIMDSARSFVHNCGCKKQLMKATRASVLFAFVKTTNKQIQESKKDRL